MAVSKWRVGLSRRLVEAGLFKSKATVTRVGAVLLGAQARLKLETVRLEGVR